MLAILFTVPFLTTYHWHVVQFGCGGGGGPSGGAGGSSADTATAPTRTASIIVKEQRRNLQVIQFKN